MARVVPSGEEILLAVERYMADRHKIAGSLSAPGEASLSWQSVLECRIDRSIEERTERPQRAKGPRSRNTAVAERPTYTDLDAHPAEPPADPTLYRRLRLVREDTLDEEPCAGCADGKQDCSTCKGRGGIDCPPSMPTTRGRFMPRSPRVRSATPTSAPAR